MNTTQTTVAPTHLAQLNGKTLRFNVAEYDTAVAAFVAEAGGGVPTITEIAEEKSAPESSPIAVGQMDEVGRLRSMLDDDAAKKAGFAPARTVYARGLRATGMAEHKADFESLPETREAMTALVAEVASEKRLDVEVRQDELRMTRSGLLVTSQGRADGQNFALSDRALSALTFRLGMPAGAGSYLRGLRPEVRAINVNRWCAEDVVQADDEATQQRTMANANLVAQGKRPRALPGPSLATLRTRESRGRLEGGTQDREVFGVVSDGYAPFDADLIARSVRDAVKATDSRAEVHYDGYRTKVDVMWFSDIRPEHAVAGEFFKAGVRVRTDDAGGGSCKVSAMVWQNLCLNFIIIDEGGQDVANIRHVGDVAKLAKLFENAFKTAEGKLKHFLEVWGYACEEDVVPAAMQHAVDLGAVDDLAPYTNLPVSKILPGIFNGIVERELVPVSRKNRDQVIGDLMAMWSKDVSGATLDREGKLTRAAVVNAFTRYAHERNDDPFKAHEIEAAAGALLYPRRGGDPRPLPFLPMQ